MKKRWFLKVYIINKFFLELILLIGLSILFFVIMEIFGHQESSFLWGGALIIFSLSKVFFLITKTMQKLDKLTKNNHSFDHLLILLSITISIIILSFAFDYLCLSEIYNDAFLGIDPSHSVGYRFIDLLYFSIVTFTNVGYGDITPLIPFAKLIAVLQMITAFVVLVFIISKYFKNNQNERQTNENR
ncbi:hypothetical protein MNBD_IGNAVI01-2662 [hydrothermal vent metagenome]|uniref:Potassium channel domain-containing protein n=1 Tax=hydrothermal vent metagenome TaxID=652676 RepID=A0A3B1BKV5_9ZZZZ